MKKIWNRDPLWNGVITEYKNIYKNYYYLNAPTSTFTSIHTIANTKSVFCLNSQISAEMYNLRGCDLTRIVISRYKKFCYMCFILKFRVDFAQQQICVKSIIRLSDISPQSVWQNFLSLLPNISWPLNLLSSWLFFLLFFWYKQKMILWTT